MKKSARPPHKASPRKHVPPSIFSRMSVKVIIPLMFLVLILLGGSVMILPRVLVWVIEDNTAPVETEQFPVTVDPARKVIAEDAEVNRFLEERHSLLRATVAGTTSYLWNTFVEIAQYIADTSWYQSLASVGTRPVTIKPGLRKEQVALVFGKTLHWSDAEQQQFFSATSSDGSHLSEGSYAPGTYVVAMGMRPLEIREIMADRFNKDVLSHYGTSTQELVPLDQALIVASLIQRETLTTEGMRLVSGVIWNRLFTGMNLQIDSTLQYARANTTNSSTWWPTVRPGDKYIKSPYNTYMNKGLPPTPIANPSVQAILAALNPIKTSCLFYFNDRNGNFHCSETYKQHVAQLEKYY